MATLFWHLPFTFSSPSCSTLSVRKCRSYQSFITSTAINEDGVHNQISTEMSSELGSDDLWWLSLSSFMDDKGQEPLSASAASQSLMGLSSSLFNDVNSFVMDKEDPIEYVPAPAVSAAVKGFIYAQWTLEFPGELQSTFKHPTSSSPKCMQSLNLSGESKFEVDRIGQVMSIESNWYETKVGEEELDCIKLLLTSLLLKEAHN